MTHGVCLPSVASLTRFLTRVKTSLSSMVRAGWEM